MKRSKGRQKPKRCMNWYMYALDEQSYMSNKMSPNRIQSFFSGNPNTDTVTVY